MTTQDMTHGECDCGAVYTLGADDHCGECGSCGDCCEADILTCWNCDKPTRGKYCSQTCEGMARLPAPRDDYETLTAKANPTVTE